MSEGVERWWEEENKFLRKENDDLRGDIDRLRRPLWARYLVEGSIVIQTVLLAAALWHLWR